MSDLIDFIKEVMIPVLLFSVIIFTPIAIVGNAYASWQCSNFEKLTGRDAQYIWFDSCYVDDGEGNMIRYDSNYKR